ncbi:MAG: peptidoglycan DD-metalloendopeptidase family protein [Synechococcales bacterium]|nr:peptidoglycan DD-metalloendopeptidase family protein [Synechococcales bacterium]
MFYLILPATQPIPVPPHTTVPAERFYHPSAGPAMNPPTIPVERPFKPSTQFVQQIPIPAPVSRPIAPPMTAFNPNLTYSLPPGVVPSASRSLPSPYPKGLPTALQFRYPLSAEAPMTSPFGWRNHPIHGERRFHSGIDLGAPHGTPVLASASGQIKFTGNRGGYGLTILIQHGDGSVETLYGHLSEILVTPGTWVEAGQVIGKVGSTGLSTGPHLHFEIRQLEQGEWVAINPDRFLSGAQPFMAKQNPFNHEEAFLRQVTQ